MIIFTKTIYMARKKVAKAEKITRVSIWVKKKHVPRVIKEVKIIEDRIKLLP